jgi:hypothetical protein
VIFQEHIIHFWPAKISIETAAGVSVECRIEVIVSRPVPTIKREGEPSRVESRVRHNYNPERCWSLSPKRHGAQIPPPHFRPHSDPHFARCPRTRVRPPLFSFMASTDASARRPFGPPTNDHPKNDHLSDSRSGGQHSIPLQTITVHTPGENPPPYDQSTSTPTTATSDTDPVATHPPSSQCPSGVEKVWKKHKNLFRSIALCGLVTTISVPFIVQAVKHPNGTGASVSSSRTRRKTSQSKGGKDHRGPAMEEPLPHVVTQAAAGPASETKDSCASSLA